MRKVISVSRRTDVIAQSYLWLQEMLKQGYVVLQNPYYPETEYKVSLAEGDVHSIVLWSKDFTNFIRNPRPLENYSLFFQYTINNYPKGVECVDGMSTHISNVLWLFNNYDIDRVTLRFDPVIFFNRGEGKKIVFDERLKSFEYIIRKIREHNSLPFVIATSYVDLNRNIIENLNASMLKIFAVSDEEVSAYFIKMKNISDQYGVTLISCADTRLKKAGIPIRGCIDGTLIEKITGEKVSRAKDNSQRQACACAKSIDIGIYPYLRGGKKCIHKCKYCYVKGAL